MARSKLRGKTKKYFEEVDKGRKKPWQPRGSLIPPNITHVPKNGYRRTKFDWKDVPWEEDDEIKIIEDAMGA